MNGKRNSTPATAEGGHLTVEDGLVTLSSHGRMAARGRAALQAAQRKYRKILSMTQCPDGEFRFSDRPQAAEAIKKSRWASVRFL
jgi:hypothetical protein